MRGSHPVGPRERQGAMRMAMKVEAGTPGWQQRHVEIYVKTDGTEGHVLDFGRPGVPEVNTLLL